MSYSIRRQSGLSTFSVSEFEWTTESPIEPGWYWASALSKAGRMFGLVYVWEDMVHCSSHNGIEIDLTEFTHWLGPLPEPFSPQKV